MALTRADNTDTTYGLAPTEHTQCPRISLVIPCRNEVGHIASCLCSVLAFEEPPGGMEVIVSDGLSNDGTRAILAGYVCADSRVRIVDNPDRTTPHGLNAGIRAARGELIIRIDAHTTYAPDYVRQCVEVMEQTGADNVGGPALTDAQSYWQRAIAAAYHSRFAVGNSSFHQPEYEGYADTVPYGCFRKSRLIEIGLFDEELIRNQDDELNYRIIRAGGRIWQSPRIRSWYSPRGSLSSLACQYFQYGYWKVRVMQKHGSPASWRHLVPGTFVAALIALLGISLVVPAARPGLAGLMAIYGIALLLAAFVTARRYGWDLLPALPPVFSVYHLGYGAGFLLGVWDFWVRSRGSGRFVRLTR